MKFSTNSMLDSLLIMTSNSELSSLTLQSTKDLLKELVKFHLQLRKKFSTCYSSTRHAKSLPTTPEHNCTNPAGITTSIKTVKAGLAYDIQETRNMIVENKTAAQAKFDTLEKLVHNVSSRVATLENDQPTPPSAQKPFKRPV